MMFDDAAVVELSDETATVELPDEPAEVERARASTWYCSLAQLPGSESQRPALPEGVISSTHRWGNPDYTGARGTASNRRHGTSKW